MTTYVEATDSGPCSDYVPASMWAPTPHAQPPGTSQASHGNFELGEAGQLEKSNTDKAGIHHITVTCETRKQAAVKRAKQQLKPWYKRIF